MHAADAGDDPVRLTQPLDEPGDDDDLAAVTFEEGRSFVEALGREQDVAAVALGQRPAAEVADCEAEVVPHHGRQEPEQPDEEDVEPPGPGVDGREDQHGLARDRYAEVLERDQSERQITELVQRRFEVMQHARKVLRRHRRQQG